MQENKGGQTFIGGLSRIFHCNHYNAFLQMTVLLSENMPGCDPNDLLKDAISPLIDYLKQQGYSQNDFIREFNSCGFGQLHQLSENTWETTRSHYSEAICLQEKPHKNCLFTSGYIQGITGKHVEEIACQIVGDKSDIFLVSDIPVNLQNYLLYSVELTELPERFAFEGCQTFSTNIDEARIQNIIKQFSFFNDQITTEDGLIDAFGVMLTRHFADYYNRISYETYFCMKQLGVPVADAKELFIKAGLYCAFFTFGGMMESQEWYNIVVPMCHNDEDWMHGMVAIINTLGWGIWRVEQLQLHEKLVIRIYNSYEGVGYRRMYPLADDKEMSFLAMGGCLGLCYLLWQLDMTEKPKLTWDFYMQHFNTNSVCYTVTQTHAIAAGDEYDRIIVASTNKMFNA